MHPVSHQTLDHRLIFFSLFPQLAGGKFEGACILQPLKFLRSLILTSDPEKTYEIGQKLGLPHVLFDLVQDAVENSAFIKVTAAGMQPSSTRPLGPAVGFVLIVFCPHFLFSNHKACQHWEKYS